MGRLFLLEVNSAPSLSTPTNLDEEIKESVLKEALVLSDSMAWGEVAEDDERICISHFKIHHTIPSKSFDFKIFKILSAVISCDFIRST